MKEIDRLRWKFMLYNMLIVTAVIGITFGSAALLVKRRGYEQVNAVLSQTAGTRQEETLIFKIPSPVRVPYFSVVVEADGSVTLQDGSYNLLPSQEVLEQVAWISMGMQGEQGILEDYSLRYLRVSHPAGCLIAFADTSYEEAMIDGMLVNGGIICGLIWLGFLVLSYFFAQWAVGPVADAVQHQKQFVADASHELKTPLTIITANAELLRDNCQGMTEQVDQWLDNVNQECIQMRHLVESLLMLARSDLTRTDTAGWESVNFSDLVMEESLTFEPVFYQLGKELDEEVEENLWVTGSPRELRQVVKILLDNAAKYSREKGLTRIRLKSVERKQVELRVISEGNVIPREQQKAVFRRFYRGDASRSRTDSYGLGLALARAIVESHRGTIRLEADGESNHFTIKIRSQTGGTHSRIPDAPR